MSQALAQPEFLIVRQAPFIQFAQDGEDPRKFGDDCPPARFGGMCGEHQADLGMLQDVTQAFGRDATLGQEPDSLPHRSSPWPGHTHLSGTNATNALAVLGQVDELEVIGKGANERLSFISAEVVYQCIEHAPGGLVTAAQGFGVAPGFLGQGEGTVAA